MTKLKRQNAEKWPVFISCGILKNEIRQIISKHNWPVKSKFLDSSLHIDLEKLFKVLSGSLKKEDAQKLVIYGTCHPKMDDLLTTHHAVKVPGQNCVELLLGKERFSHELSKGAFFLFEDWARRWEEISFKYFGNWEIMREIFQDSHKYILCLKTPCSGDFKDKAEHVSQLTGLPLIWEKFDLINLENVLTESLFNLTGTESDA